ncbi:MAG: glycosyltransferase [Gammaproteobacteria bacterium]|nr:glycosyltransferase [Gammaproteobacteria bacterium]MCU0971098.1 glycosyltransferase [Gammaproteobacteria bacterium]
MGEPSRVAILSPLYSGGAGAHGGITPVVTNLAAGLAAGGTEIDLLVRLPPGFAAPGGLPPRVRLYDLGARHRLGTALAVARHLRARTPAALLAAGHRYNLAAAWAGRLTPAVRLVLSVHNAISPEASARGGFKQWQRLRAVDHGYRRADAIVCVSRGVADDLLASTRIDPARVRVIHNPIVTPELLRRGAEPLDHPWLAPGAPPVILGVGRLAPQKAFHHLIAAFAAVRAARPCRLLILGEGGQRDALEGRIRALGLASDVALPGFVPNPYPYMRAAALLALSSDFEGFGNVLVEAMALGTPVVSTDCPSGPAEILDRGRYGRLVPVGDAAALAQAIGETLDAPRDRAGLAEAAARFAVSAAVARYRSVLGLGPPCA